jgi:hypothetical protein
MTPKRKKVKKPDQGDSKEKFRAALEKKNQISREQRAGGDPDAGRKIQASSGNIPKLFRRKSG